MAASVLRTWYEIWEISRDGLLKRPQESGYGQDSSRFPGEYESMEEVDKAILESGESYTDYIVLTGKRITSA